MAAKISILTFPQRQEGNTLFLNVLVIPRNLDPFLDDPMNALSPAWVNANLRFQVRLIDSLTDYPRLDLAAQVVDLNLMPVPATASAIFTSLNQPGRLEVNSTKRAEPLALKSDTVRKYLPGSYRNSFNFTSPRNPQLTELGDGYRCAIRDNPTPDKTFTPKYEMSWGKLFAYCLRQPDLAKKCGFVHTELQVPLVAGSFKNGGWVYVDLHPDSSYYAQSQVDLNFLKRYAARLPKLDLNSGRILFAAVQFPVLNSLAVPGPDDPVQPTMLDDLQIEAAEYDDGFCKIVHSNQPVSGDLLLEEEDEELPVSNDAGIRLGWDDEQLLIWMHRQMSEDPKLGGQKRADAPLGVFQYRVDVREKPADENNPGPWSPLCRVKYDKTVLLDQTQIGAQNEERELGVEVYPVRLDANQNASFWLPQYFSQWTGRSLVIQDEDAIAIYKKDQIDKNSLDPADTSAPKKASKNNNYQPVGLNTALRYGKSYQFRVRMTDTTGGGPAIDRNPVHDSEAPVANQDFRRYVIPQTLKFVSPLPAADDALFTANSLRLQRPLLGYPSVLFTGGYNGVIQKLIADADAIIAGNLKRDVGLPDPDVNRVEVIVEVRGLEMDTLLPKRDKKDSFAILYKTYRNFDNDIDDVLDIPLNFVDAPVLQFSLSANLSGLGIIVNGADDFDDRTDLILPTARDIRITVRAVTREADNYFGGTERINDVISNRRFLKGMISSFYTRKESASEWNVFKGTSDSQQIRGIFLQPDELPVVRDNNAEYLVANLAGDNSISSIMQRLSKAIDADERGLSLTGMPGERWQFGASRSIRHQLAPDGCSLTFSSKADLINHWLVPVTLLVDRDWSWDAVEVQSVDVFRRKIFLKDAMAAFGETDRISFLDNNSLAEIFANVDVQAASEEQLVGEMKFHHTINIQALANADRSQTHFCYIDAVEPKPDNPTDFPDEILLHYRVKVNYRVPGVPADSDLLLYLHLPITTTPAQVPKIVSAGLAYSKYVRDKLYANTEARQKYLWVEFERPVDNPDDALYVRLLAYATDPLLAQWRREMLRAPKEPPLPIDPEPIRNISPGHTDDRSGLNAMQELILATDSKVHYLVPLPPGLHPEAAELFGFFTLEFRVGHKIGWSTAQGRFGRALRNTGAQFPTPQLFCVPERTEAVLSVSAPFAHAVFDGRNVTAIPPRTELWALLYARVRMADDSDNRNILIDDRRLLWQRPVAPDPNNPFLSTFNSDAVPTGFTAWSNKEIESMLATFGLPVDSELSVLCVELLPGYNRFVPLTSILKNTVFHSEWGLRKDIEISAQLFQAYFGYVYQLLEATQMQADMSQTGFEDGPHPLTTELGSNRILRTSTLIEVPEICCTV